MSDMAQKELAALNYVQQKALNNGLLPESAVADEFERHYTQKERKYIDKLYRMMTLFNYTMNFFELKKSKNQ